MNQPDIKWPSDFEVVPNYRFPVMPGYEALVYQYRGTDYRGYVSDLWRWEIRSIETGQLYASPYRAPHGAGQEHLWAVREDIEGFVHQVLNPPNDEQSRALPEEAKTVAAAF